jgi:Domain of unknown function (DUF5753)
LRRFCALSGSRASASRTLLALCRQAKERGWWQSYGSAVPGWFQFYVGLESEASAISEYSAEVVPGLLQTAGYYRAFLSTAPADADIDGKVEVRLARQERLTSADDPPEYWAVLNEGVIRRTVGPNGTMSAQLEHLAELADLPNVTLQVLPFSAGVHPAMDGGFSILGSPTRRRTRPWSTRRTRRGACTWRRLRRWIASAGCSAISSRRRSARRTRASC